MTNDELMQRYDEAYARVTVVMVLMLATVGAAQEPMWSVFTTACRMRNEAWRAFYAAELAAL